MRGPKKFKIQNKSEVSLCLRHKWDLLERKKYILFDFSLMWTQNPCNCLKRIAMQAKGSNIMKFKQF